MHGGRTAVAATTPPRVRVLDDWLALSLLAGAGGGGAPAFTLVATKLEPSAALAAAGTAVHGHGLCVMPGAGAGGVVEVAVAGGDVARGKPCAMYRAAVDVAAGTVDLVDGCVSTCSRLQALRRSSRLLVASVGPGDIVAAALPRDASPGATAAVDVWRLRWSESGVTACRVSRVPACMVTSGSVRLIAGTHPGGRVALFGCSANGATAQLCLWKLDRALGTERSGKRGATHTTQAGVKRARSGPAAALDGRPRCMLALAQAPAGTGTEGKPPGCASARIYLFARRVRRLGCSA